MTTDEADSKNQEIRKHGQDDIKNLIIEMLEMDADQVMWGHIADLAVAAQEMQDELNGEDE